MELLYRVTKLTNICRRDKAPGAKIVLENVSDPFGVPLVGFLAPNSFHIFGVSQNNIAGALQNVVNGNPILSGGFHTHIFTVVFVKPDCTTPQISRKGGETLAFVGGNPIGIGRGNTSYHKGFVNIYSTTDRVKDFEHNTSP